MRRREEWLYINLLETIKVAVIYHERQLSASCSSPGYLLAYSALMCNHTQVLHLMRTVPHVFAPFSHICCISFENNKNKDLDLIQFKVFQGIVSSSTVIM